MSESFGCNVLSLSQRQIASPPAFLFARPS